MKRKLTRSISVVLMILMILCAAPLASVADFSMLNIFSEIDIVANAAYENTYKNTGNQRKDILGVAKTQIGNTNGNKYGSGNWCAHFIVWCARQAGIGESIIKTTGWATADDLGIAYKGRSADRTVGISYTPQPGDIIIFDYYNAEKENYYCYKEPPSNYGDHVGIVEYVSDGYVHTIEGNSGKNPSVKRQSYKLTYSEIKGYGIPKYKNSEKYLSVNFNANGGSISSDTYKLSSNVIYNKSDSTKYCQKWTYNQTKENGLVNCETFGIYKTGYTFAGWGTKASGGTVFDDRDANVKPSDMSPDIKNGSCSITLYAQWKPNTLEVSYNANGGSISSDTYKLSSSVLYNKSDNTKTVQKWTYNQARENGLINWESFGIYKTGYTFAGWSTKASGGTVFDDRDTTIKPTDLSSDIKNKNCKITLYAQWRPNVLSVYYKANGAKITSDKYKISSDTLYLKSDGKKYEHKWEYNKAKENGLANYGTFGLYKDGYTFAGWGTKENGGTIYGQSDFSIVPTTLKSDIKNGDCSITLYAQWKPNTIKVYYNANGATVTSDTYKLSSNLICDKASGEKLYQKWTYNITKENGLYNASTFGLKKTGYSFAGWGTSASGGTVFDENNTALTPLKLCADVKKANQSITLYAQWVPNTVKIYYHANGGTVSSDKYKLVSNFLSKKENGAKSYNEAVYNSPVQNGLINASTFGLYRTGYTFAGWSTKTSGGTIINENDTTIVPTDFASGIKNGSCTVTMYAQWTPNKVTMHFQSAGELLCRTHTLSGSGKLVTSSAIERVSATQLKYNSKTYSVTGNKTAILTYGKDSPRLSIAEAGLSLSGHVGNGYIAFRDCDNKWRAYINDTLGWYTAAEINKAVSDGKFGGYHIYTQTGTLSQTAPKGNIYFYALWVENHTHSYSVTDSFKGSCTAAAYTVHTCSCGDSYVNMGVVTGHSMKLTTTDATCEKAGASVNTCTACGYSESTEIPAKGHNYKVSETVNPTCITEGKTVYRCVNCKDEYSEAIECVAHKYTSKNIQATCTSNGYVLNICEVCNDEKTGSFTPPKAHNYHSSVVAPTCVGNGYTVKICSDCFAHEETDIVAPTGHKWSDWTVKESPDCVNTGINERVCTACSESEEKTISATGHSFTEETFSPDCTENGYTLHTCKNCDYSYTDNIVSALGHDEKNHSAKLPTCTELGWNAYVTCSRCDYTTYEEKAKLGHDYKNTVTAPTCTKEGYTTHTCTRCNDTYTDTKVKALGHNYKNTVTAPTCTKEGYTTHTCTRCKDTYTDTKVKALGHNYKNTVTAPTCTKEGYTTHSCTRCNSTYTDTKVSATGHKWSAWKEILAPTFTTKGREERACTACDMKEARETAMLTSELGDVDGNGKITAADARLALRASVGLESFNPTKKATADIDGSNTVTAADARLILRASVGLEDLKKYKK